MRYKNFFYGLVLVLVNIVFDAPVHSSSSENDIRREEVSQQGCDSLGGPANCYNEDRGKIAGDLVIYGTPPVPHASEYEHNSLRYDREGLPIPKDK